MCDGCQTSFTTYYGTGILGMFVTWSNTAVDSIGTISGTTELSVDVDLRLAAANVNTVSGDAIDATSSATHNMVYYLQFLNPYMSATSPNTALGTLLYDAAVADILITTTAGTATVSRDLAVFDWDGDALSDSYCTAEHSPTSVCTNDTTNDWTTTTTGDQCVEKWDIVDPAIRCVRMKSTMKRLFRTTDANSQDFYFAYRPFMVSAGWVIASAITTPLKMEFTR